MLFALCPEVTGRSFSVPTEPSVEMFVALTVVIVVVAGVIGYHFVREEILRD